MQMMLANPRGFCAGVDRAILIVKRALETLGAPIYVRHEVVHNRAVVEGLRAQGAVFVEELHEVPDGAVVIFSAHGVPRAVVEEAAQRGLRIFDATCPLVTKVHLEVIRFARQGWSVILIGHAGHPEVEGTMGQFERQHGGEIILVETLQDVAQLTVAKPEKLAYVSQTTLSVRDSAVIVEALRQRFPHIRGPKKDDICYATQNRQDAVAALAQECDVVLVVGSANSSNSNRLRELAEQSGCRAYLVDNADDLQRKWLNDVKKIGITAGASAPEYLVSALVERLQEWGAECLQERDGQREDIHFALPLELR